VASREASDVRSFGGAFKGWSRDVIQSEKGEPQTLPQGWVLLAHPAEHGGGMFTGLAQQADELRTPDIRHLVFVPDAPVVIPLTKFFAAFTIAQPVSCALLFT
jgi:hypothetical protein